MIDFFLMHCKLNIYIQLTKDIQINNAIIFMDIFMVLPVFTHI